MEFIKILGVVSILLAINWLHYGFLRWFGGRLVDWELKNLSPPWQTLCEVLYAVVIIPWMGLVGLMGLWVAIPEFPITRVLTQFCIITYCLIGGGFLFVKTVRFFRWGWD